MPSEAATLYFPPYSKIRYPNRVVIDLRIRYKEVVERDNACVSISRAQRWHKMFLLRELWPQKYNDAKFHK
jgi:hypothetical protein